MKPNSIFAFFYSLPMPKLGDAVRPPGGKYRVATTISGNNSVIFPDIFSEMILFLP